MLVQSPKRTVQRILKKSGKKGVEIHKIDLKMTQTEHFLMTARAIMEKKLYGKRTKLPFPVFFSHLSIGKSAKNMMQAGDANRTRQCQSKISIIDLIELNRN